MYVTNRTSGTVSVISTADNKVVNTITVGTQPESITFNTDGTRAYVTNYGSKSVSVIDTTLAQQPKVIATISNVGTNPRGIAYVQTANGPRVYVANSGAGTVSVINALTNKLIDTKPSTTLTVDPISVGSAPQQIAVSPDRTRIYVTNQNSNSVSVINTATNAIDGAAIAVGSKPAGVALSADGSTLYVANGDDSVSVVDTKTRTVFGLMTLDGVPENNLHAVVVRDDGGLLVTDLADQAVRIVNYQRGNTAPVALADPSVGNANTSTGAISGAVNIKDWDGDSLSYSTGTAPARGTVTFDPAAGTYTYTPTQPARDAAALTPGDDFDTFTIRATDTKNASTTSTLVVVTVLPSANPPTQNPNPLSPVRSADPFTGEVRGSVGPSGLTYTVISAPANGTVTVTPQGEFVYRPMQAARLAADQTAGADIDNFTVRVTNGQTSTTLPVTVPVMPAQLTVDNQFAPAVGNGAAGVDLNYRRAWIVNQADGTMTIIAVPNGAPVATIPVGNSPTSVAFDGMAYAWVTNQASNTVSVVDLVYNPGAVTTLSGFNQPSAVVTDYPGLVFVANKGNGTVSVLNSSSRQVIRTFQVGQSPTAMALTGAHLYIANSGSNTVSMIDLETNSVRATIPVGTAPTAVATNPNGTRVYVTNSNGTVSVVDASTNTVIGSPVRVGPQPSSVSVSPDGSLAYVANADDTVSVIDTRTNTVVRTVAIDPNPEMGSHSLVISQELTYPPRRPDGARIYITDAADKTVRAISLTPPAPPEIAATTTPVSVANPSATVTVGNRAYVATGDYNSYTNNVSVIDLDPTSPTYKQVIDTIPVSYMNGWYVPASPAIVATRQGDRVFVTDPENNNVLAIDTSTNTVVDTYAVPVLQPEYYEVPNSVSDVILSGDGSRLYVASTDGYIRAIDTASKSVVGATLAGSDMAVSPDGRRLYVTGGEAITVYDTASMSKVGEIHVGPSQFDNSRQIAISEDGTRAYVTGRVAVVEDANAGYFQGESIITDSAGNLWRVVGSYDVVSVIDVSSPTSPTYNTEIATIPITTSAWDVATSSDGKRVYVTASDGKTVTVIDATTNTVIGQVTTDQNVGGIRSISVGANDTLYITDGYDGTVYAVAVGAPPVV